jgi:TonB family protein
MNAVAVRGDWVGQVIDGRYPLLEWLGGSGTSGTFLTELDGLGSHKAAIKLLPSSPQSEDRLSGWAAAAKLSHPHLAHIDHFGRAEVNGNSCVYIVCDLAEELLSQIIPERPLTADEAHQMLTPILSALDYLHNNGLAHGHLKPSNILVVENDIRLSSDSLVPLGRPVPDLLTSDIHIAPEITADPVSPRADIWSLGITVVEALTQQLPIWDAASDNEPVLPATIPAPFAEIARRCLQADPERRCTLAEIRAILEGPINRSAPKPAAPPLRAPDQHRLADKPLPARMPFLPLVIGLVLLLAIIIGLRMHSRRTVTTPPTETTSQASAAEPESKAAAPQPPPSTPAQASAPNPAPSSNASSASDVLNRDIPEVSERASNTIHGTVSVVVRVSVDPTGAVTNVEYTTHGPSAYFARIALESARNWKFRPPQQDGRTLPSSWVLHYRFRRTGVDVTPDQTRR